MFGGGSAFRNVVKFLPDYIASYPIYDDLHITAIRYAVPEFA